jgi:hypothetical protein
VRRRFASSFVVQAPTQPVATSSAFPNATQRNGGTLGGRAKHMTLGAFLADWTDVDVAAHELARSLGAMPERSAMSDAKWVYWSNNPLGIELVALLERLTVLGFLEKRDEPDYQYRVAPRFRSRLGIEEIWQRFVAPPRPE